MRKLKYIIFIFLVMSCKNSNKQHGKKNNNKHGYTVSSDTVVLDSSISYKSSSDSLYIYFESYFNNDSATIIFDNKVVFNKAITTDNTIGLADFFKIKKNNGVLKIDINHNIPIIIKTFNDYKFLTVNKNNNRVKYFLTNKKAYYK